MGSRKRSNIYGWESENEVAVEIYCSPFRDLLEGRLVFAYKNFSKTGTVKLMIVTKVQGGYRIGFTPFEGSWNCYYPCASSGYLREVLLSDLQKNKTEKHIIEDFIYCINYYDKN